jgi:hypothetical protein
MERMSGHEKRFFLQAGCFTCCSALTVMALIPITAQMSALN